MRARQTWSPVRPASPLASGRRGRDRLDPFPIVLISCGRAAYLNATLASLLAVRGVRPGHVYVLQDKVDPEVEAVVRGHGLRQHHSPARAPAPHRQPTAWEQGKMFAETTGGGHKVADAYRRALGHAFGALIGDDAAVVVEDDLLFSPDMMEFFLAGWSAMRDDPTLWCVSAWNDNGLKEHARHPRRLRRTGYFPGLGWLLSRRLWEELEGAWPLAHWDHWMRTKHVSRGRECVYPEVSRTWHAGLNGTFMTSWLHERYFAARAFNRAPLSWRRSEWASLGAQLRRPAYEAALKARLRRARPLLDFRALLDGGTEELALWFRPAPRRSKQRSIFPALAGLFGVWPDPGRANHRGVIEVWCRTRRVLLVDVTTGAEGGGGRTSGWKEDEPAYRHLARASATFTSAAALNTTLRRAGLGGRERICASDGEATAGRSPPRIDAEWGASRLLVNDEQLASLSDEPLGERLHASQQVSCRRSVGSAGQQLCRGLAGAQASRCEQYYVPAEGGFRLCRRKKGACVTQLRKRGSVVDCARGKLEGSASRSPPAARGLAR